MLGNQRLQSEIERYREIKKQRVIQKARKRTQIKDGAIRTRFKKQQPLVSVSENNLHVEDCDDGTVATMNILPAFHAPLDIKAVDVARIMASNSVDAVLIIEADELCGIVTDKDLLASILNYDSSLTPVSKIMSSNVIYAYTNDTVDDVVMKMIHYKFRHLPVVDSKSHTVVGMLDIIQVLNHVQSIIANSWGKARKLVDAYEEFKLAWNTVKSPPEVTKWFEEWNHSMPTLKSLMLKSSNTTPTTIPSVKTDTSVRQAVKVMHDYKSTAVIITDISHQLVGIFTSKDLLLRIIANNEAIDVSIMRVMTPFPDTADELMHVDDALDRMYKNTYQHIPVTSNDGAQGFAYDGDNRIIGIIDVLTLTRHTLNMLMKQQSIGCMYSSTPQAVFQQFKSNDYFDLEPSSSLHTSHVENINQQKKQHQEQQSRSHFASEERFRLVDPESDRGAYNDFPIIILIVLFVGLALK